MKLTIKQTKALDLLEDKTTTELYFGGAAGGGKSIIGNYWLLKSALKYTDTRWVMGRKELKALKETTLVSFFKVAKMQNYSNFKFNAQSNAIVFPNRSIIMLRDLAFYPSDPDFDSLGSLEITGAFIDEAPQIRQKAKDILKSRIRHGLDENGLIPKLFMSGNPSKNWAYKESFDSDRKKELPLHKAFIQSLVTDNPFISKHYIDNLMQIKDDATKQRLLYGNWDYDNDPSQLISYEQILNCYTNSFVATGEKYLTADIAGEGSDRFVVVYWDGWRAERFYIFKKLQAPEVEAKLKELAELHKVPRSNIIYDADGLGHYLRGYLAGAYPFNNGSQPMPRKDNLNNEYKENYQHLKAQCSYLFAEKANANEIYINIPESIKEDFEEEIQAACKSWQSDNDGKIKIIPKDEVKTVISRSPDIWDALMMRSAGELKPKPIPIW